MLDRLEELEGKVLALVRLLSERAEQISHLERENQKLAAELDQAEESMRALEADKASLQQEVDSNVSREGEIRERLKGIIERISRFETELSSSELGGIE